MGIKRDKRYPACGRQHQNGLPTIMSVSADLVPVAQLCNGGLGVTANDTLFPFSANSMSIYLLSRHIH